MKNLLFIIILTNLLYSNENIYYMKYLENDTIKTIEVNKKFYLDCQNLKNKSVIFEGKTDKNKVIKCYQGKTENIDGLGEFKPLNFDNNNSFGKTENIEEKKELNEVQEKEQETTLRTEETEKGKISYMFGIVLLITVLFLYYEFSKLGKPLKVKEEEKTQKKEDKKETKKESLKRTHETEEKTQTETKKILLEKTETIDIKNIDILSYQLLEKERIEIYKELKRIKTIEKEEKKELYKSIRELKENIKNKEDLETLSISLYKIKKGVRNE